jgi:hypothetical protein
MARSTIHSLCGIALMLSGASVALWPLTHPWGTFTGAVIGQSQQWMVAHTFHFLAGAFGLLGLLGFVERQVTVASTFERFAFVLAFLGTMLFAATGLFTAFLWPVLARNAPALTELQGPFFSPPHPLILITTISYSMGYILLAIALLRTHAMAKWGALLLMAGAFLMMIPPAPLSPLPWVVFPVGGVVFGSGLAALGLVVRNGFRVPE